jgi:hypothetical protein
MASYDQLNPAQQAEFDRLMTTPTSTWPDALIAHVRGWGGSFCGDALADAVEAWVRGNV